MKNFTFNVEQKSTIWEYGWVNMEAETYEEAKEKVIAMFEEEDGWNINDFVKPDLQTIEGMVPSQNGGRPTRFLYTPGEDDEEDYILWDNSNN
jgi:aspartyl aminopeptidase